MEAAVLDHQPYVAQRVDIPDRVAVHHDQIGGVTVGEPISSPGPSDSAASEVRLTIGPDNARRVPSAPIEPMSHPATVARKERRDPIAHWFASLDDLALIHSPTDPGVHLGPREFKLVGDFLA